jgi:ubiquinone/menaquinone biosynthesis C-methylase UbiE
MDIAQSASKLFLEMFKFDKHRGHIWTEYCNTRNSLSEAEKQAMELKTAELRYEEAKGIPLEDYFRRDLTQYLKGADVLELGCNFGGGALAYFEKYKLKSITGIDIEDEHITTCNALFQKWQPAAQYKFMKAFAENLPLADESVDAIITFDVLEHVASVPDALRECYRILRPGGMMLLSFPSFFHITGHHLYEVSMAPCIHWFLPRHAIAEAYNDLVVKQPGHELDSRPLMDWERLFGLNGMSFRRFRRLLKTMQWIKAERIPLPVGAVGKAVEKLPVLKVLRAFFKLGVRLPVLEEFCNNRIVYVLTK